MHPCCLREVITRGPPSYVPLFSRKYLAATLLLAAPASSLTAVLALRSQPPLPGKTPPLGKSIAVARLGSVSSLSATTSTSSMGGDDRVGGTKNAGSLTFFLNTCSQALAASSTPPALPSAAESGRRSGGVNDDKPLLFHAFSGNEACDADSICSALCLAFLESNIAAAAAAAPASPVASAGTSNGICEDAETMAAHDRVVHIPVMPIPRADLALRREVLVLFDLCGVDPSAVTFLDDVSLSALQAEGRLRLTLVDHNAVSGGLTSLGDSVVEIVDHHMDLGLHDHVRGGSRDIAFDAQAGNGKPLVGSCCTLVAERMLAQAPGLLSSDVARLLLGVILVDTINLDVDAKRATPRDVAVVEELSRRVAWLPRIAGQSSKVSLEGSSEGSAEPPSSSVGALFDTLRNAKFDPVFWKGLSGRDCLRYDYKQFVPKGSGAAGDKDSGVGHSATDTTTAVEFGMSSVLCRVSALTEKLDAAGAMRAFALERGIDSLVIMTSVLDGGNKMRKELLVVTDSMERCKQMEEFLEGPKGEFLRLQRQVSAPLSTASGSLGENGGVGKAGGGCHFLHWELGNVAPSRKQIAPVIMSFYESLVA